MDKERMEKMNHLISQMIQSILKLKKQLKIAEKRQMREDQIKIDDGAANISDQAINVEHYVKIDQKERGEAMKLVESHLDKERIKLRQVLRRHLKSMKCKDFMKDKYYKGFDYHRIGTYIHELEDYFDYLEHWKDYKKIRKTLKKIIELDITIMEWEWNLSPTLFLNHSLSQSFSFLKR